MFDKIKNAEQLLNDINEKKKKWDERSQFKLKGIGNLSLSDMDTLELYATTYICNGSFCGLLKPLGAIAEVLTKYNIL